MEPSTSKEPQLQIVSPKVGGSKKRFRPLFFISIILILLASAAVFWKISDDSVWSPFLLPASSSNNAASALKRGAGSGTESASSSMAGSGGVPAIIASQDARSTPNASGLGSIPPQMAVEKPSGKVPASGAFIPRQGLPAGTASAGSETRAAARNSNGTDGGRSFSQTGGPQAASRGAATISQRGLGASQGSESLSPHSSNGPGAALSGAKMDPATQRLVNNVLSKFNTQMAQMKALAAANAQAERQIQQDMQQTSNAAYAPPPPEIQQTLQRGKFWPLKGTVAQEFGPTSFTMEPPRSYHGAYYPHFHSGIDIAAPMDTPLHAFDAGQVIFSGGTTAGGVRVLIKHPGGLVTTYWHMDNSPGRGPTVSAGQYVTAGQIIGYVGMTGMTTGPHCHFMTQPPGQDIVNPRTVLP